MIKKEVGEEQMSGRTYKQEKEGRYVLGRKERRKEGRRGVFGGHQRKQEGGVRRTKIVSLYSERLECNHFHLPQMNTLGKILLKDYLTG